MFNVGDWVECIDDSAHAVIGIKELELGKLYQIIQCYGVDIRVVSDGLLWKNARFKLITAQPAVNTIDYFAITKSIIGEGT